MIKKALFYKRADNPWAGKKLSGVRSGHITKAIDYYDLKDKLKKMKCSYNDLFMAITSNIMAEYFESKGFTKKDRLQIFMPFSLREQGDYGLYNAVSSLVFQLVPTKDFEVALEDIKKQMNYYKHSSMPYAF